MASPGRFGGRRRRAVLSAWAAALFLTVAAPAPQAFAYSAAGDRVFVATALLPQIAPSDQFYFWAWTWSLPGGGPGAADRAINLGGAFEKTLSERLSIHVENSWFRFNRIQAGALHGFVNLETELKYLLVNDHDREFLLTLGLNREWGGTGATLLAFRKGATTPRVYFGKGLGDLDIGYLRPLALSGFAGYQASDATPRPDFIQAGFVVEYSIPYLRSKVQGVDLPDLLRAATPMTEVLTTIPAGRSFGARTVTVVAPGVNFAGDGWEFILSALLPTTRNARPGVRAQFHIALDFLFPDTIGRPLLALP